MTPRFRHLLLTLVLLMVLLAIEFGASFLPLDRSARPLVLIPAVLMVGVVGMLFMEVGRVPKSCACSLPPGCSGLPYCLAWAAWTR